MSVCRSRYRFPDGLVLAPSGSAGDRIAVWSGGKNAARKDADPMVDAADPDGTLHDYWTGRYIWNNSECHPPLTCVCAFGAIEHHDR